MKNYGHDCGQKVIWAEPFFFVKSGESVQTKITVTITVTITVKSDLGGTRYYLINSNSIRIP